jgi:cysteine synthase B
LGGGRVLLDSTSGNMGIAYATLASSLGLRLCLAVPSNVSPERLAILRAHAVELHLTDPTEGTDGARLVAAELAAQDPERYFFADQYSNPANWQAHFRTTGPEVVRQTQGQITHFVAGLGTTGTMTGTGRFLRQSAPSVRLVAVQPDGPIHGLEGLKHLATARVPEIFDPAIPDETITVDTESAYAMARRLARTEGLLVGVSAAAAADAGLRVAERLDSGTVVVVFPDSGLKYLGGSFWSAA